MTDPKSVRSVIAEEVRLLIEDQTEVSLPDVAQRVAVMVRTDPDLCDRWIDETLVPVAYDVAQRVLATGRTMVRIGDRYRDRDALNDELDAPSGTEADTAISGLEFFALWFEQVPHRKRHVRLFEMNRSDLEDAARKRRADGEVELRTAAFLTELAKRLSVNESVGTKWTPEEVAHLYHDMRVSVSVRVTNGTPVEPKQRRSGAALVAAK